MYYNNPKIDRLGVVKLNEFFSEVGWLFREQFVEDYGIDAQVELILDDKPTGALIAIQVKSGTSYFKEESEDYFVYRGEKKHLEYWTNHCLPVLIVLYHPKDKRIYWEHVNQKTIINTSKSWKIHLLKDKFLSKDSLKELFAISQGPKHIQKLNKLRLDKKWIDLLSKGETISIEFLDWINKSLPRFGITISCDGNESVETEEWPISYLPGYSLEEAISTIIPWADFELDIDAYRDFQESEWCNECYMGKDPEDGEIYYSQSFESWYKTPTETFVPISDDGETQGYRLFLKLNDIGRSFIILSKYLDDES